jgi:phosphate transport system permease protein
MSRSPQAMNRLTTKDGARTPLGSSFSATNIMGDSRPPRKTRLARRHLEEWFFKALMLLSFLVVVGSLSTILVAVIAKGLPALNLQMLTQTPQGGYYLGKEGGILNAIVGSLYLAGGATFLALLLGLPIALYLEVYARGSRRADIVRLSLDVLWGVPSIVYGAFGFTVMLALGLRASLLGGILTLALLELPIMTRAMDEVIKMIPLELKEATFALGTTRIEAATTVIVRQVLSGILTGVLLAFGRGIGDAASVLFTAGYTDRLPGSPLRPAASLPLAVFFQLGTPFPEVQQRAYAAALILTCIVLAVSLGSRWLAGRLARNVIK